MEWLAPGGMIADEFPWRAASPEAVFRARRVAILAIQAELEAGGDEAGAALAAAGAAAVRDHFGPLQEEDAARTLCALAAQLVEASPLPVERRRVLVGELIVIAALMGGGEAATLLRTAVLHAPRARRRLGRRRLAWLRMLAGPAPPWASCFPALLGEWLRWLQSVEAQPEPEPQPEPDTPPEPAPPRRRTREKLVVAEALSLQISMGDELAKRYGALATSLPLAGDFTLNAAGDFAMIAALRKEFPWMGAAIEAIEDQMRLSAALDGGSLRLRPMLLVGPPGGGKTRFALRLAELSGCGFGMLNAAGSTDNRLLAGTARGWATASPCLPAQVMTRTRCANPLIVIDEIEKASPETRNGRVQDTLLTMLEPASARAWPDEGLVTPLDLSRVNWLFTANSLEGLSAPLLSRLDVLEVGCPGPGHFEVLLAGILRDVAADFGRPADDLPRLAPEERALLQAGFEKGLSPRRLRAAVMRLLARGLRPHAGPSH
jgi:hypothetical protein